MAETKTFRCSVVTPERVVLEAEARFAALPAHDGEIGILRDRAPLLVKLDVGRLRIETADERYPASSSARPRRRGWPRHWP
jgi:F0F1-type ATP synthase epsilon subunit